MRISNTQSNFLHILADREMIRKKDYTHMMSMLHQWTDFKRARKDKKFQFKIDESRWITMLKREKMIDDLFSILAIIAYRMHISKEQADMVRDHLAVFYG